MLLLRTGLRIDAAGVTPTHVVCMQRLTDELCSWIGKLMCKAILPASSATVRLHVRETGGRRNRLGNLQRWCCASVAHVDSNKRNEWMHKRRMRGGAGNL